MGLSDYGMLHRCVRLATERDLGWRADWIDMIASNQRWIGHDPQGISKVVTAVTRRRIYWLGGAMLVAYAASLILIGLAVGFDHSAAQWLIAAGLVAIAVGMSASASLHVAVVIGDPELRTRLWAKAGWFTRGWRAFFLIARIAVAIVMWGVAVDIVRR
jgi:hypothetical protein